jgi:CDP-paratose 2-epimerase
MCIKNNAKIIFLSTSRVYSIDAINNLEYKKLKTRYKLLSKKDGIDNEGFNEKFETNGHKTLYGATKFSAEMIIEEYSHIANIDYIINRSGVIAGKGQFGKVDQGFVTLWITNYYFDKPLYIFGNGKQVRDILNINDLIELIDLQLHKFNEFKNQTFNIGGGIKNSLSLIELDTLCKEIIKDKTIKFKPERILDIKYYVTDYNKISKFWKPKISPKETVLEIFEWIKQNEKELKWIFA